MTLISKLSHYPHKHLPEGGWICAKSGDAEFCTIVTIRDIVK